MNFINSLGSWVAVTATPGNCKGYLVMPNMQIVKWWLHSVQICISMSNVKQVANKYNVKTSAVVISIIAGAIRKFCGASWDKDVSIGYPLPKSDHPEDLTNHCYMSALCLPTGQQCIFQRLQDCNT